MLTGLDTGELTVEGVPLLSRPADLEQGWDVVGELDVVCVSGRLVVTDWAGESHPELPDLAAAGPGRYRLRIHARDRSAINVGDSDETHRLMAWPVTAPSPPQMLTKLDAYGREFVAGDSPPAPVDHLDEAAIAAVDEL